MANRKTTARRPRRSYAEELEQDMRITSGLQVAVQGLERRYPDVPEFTVAQKMLREAVGLLETRVPIEPAPVTTEAVEEIEAAVS